MKKIKYIFVFLCLGFISEFNAQTQQALLNRTKHWRFGHKAGLDFNMTSGVPTVFNGSNGVTYEGNSSISDTLGNLLFYCTGDTVWNKNHQMMLNGAGLTSDKVSGVNSTIIPRPGNATQYFLFVNSCTNNSPNTSGGLRYSIIDMTLDGGNGAIITGQKNKLAFSNVTCYNLAVTKNLNNTDYWIGYCEGIPPYNICMIPVKAAGPDTINRVISSYSGPLGFSRFSPDNTLFATTNYEVFQFDASTGILNNRLLFPTDSLSNYSPFSCEFSPNSNVIYFSLYQGTGNHNVIQQFDLSVFSSTALASSAYSFFDVPANYCNCSLGHLQLALNGKIYIAKPGGTNPFDSLHIINNPNGLGATCNYQYNALNLNGRACVYSLPIYPNFYFKNIPLLTTVFEKEKFNSFPISIYPNPCDLSLTLKHQVLNSYLYQIYNAFGQKVTEKSCSQLSDNIDTSQLPNGLYYLHISSSFGNQVKKIIINH